MSVWEDQLKVLPVLIVQCTDLSDKDSSVKNSLLGLLTVTPSSNWFVSQTFPADGTWRNACSRKNQRAEYGATWRSESGERTKRGGGVAGRGGPQDNGCRHKKKQLGARTQPEYGGNPREDKQEKTGMDEHEKVRKRQRRRWKRPKPLPRRGTGSSNRLERRKTSVSETKNKRIPANPAEESWIAQQEPREGAGTTITDNSPTSGAIDYRQRQGRKVISQVILTAFNPKSYASTKGYRNIVPRRERWMTAATRPSPLTDCPLLGEKVPPSGRSDPQKNTGTSYILELLEL
nr:hypothetical protein Iba_chr13aCG11890 [Ipomoea batatas]